MKKTSTKATPKGQAIYLCDRLLNIPENDGQTVVIVENEQIAIKGAKRLPELIWAWTDRLTVGALAMALEHRHRVVLYPDCVLTVKRWYKIFRQYKRKHMSDIKRMISTFFTTREGIEFLNNGLINYNGDYDYE